MDHAFYFFSSQFLQLPKYIITGSLQPNNAEAKTTLFEMQKKRKKMRGIFCDCKLFSLFTQA